MIRRVLVGVATVGLVLVAVGVGLYVTNAAPSVPRLTESEAARTDTPYVIKLHAQWCSICLATKSVWTEVADTYTGRVRFVVFDFTSDETTERSRVEATRLGLRPVFDEFEGGTGSVLVVNGGTKAVISDIHGSRDVAEYRQAIDQALQLVAR